MLLCYCVTVLHVIDGLDSQLVRGPVRTDCDGGEVQLPQVDPVNGARTRVLVPVSDKLNFNLIFKLGSFFLRVGRKYEDREISH